MCEYFFCPFYRVLLVHIVDATTQSGRCDVPCILYYFVDGLNGIFGVRVEPDHQLYIFVPLPPSRRRDAMSAYVMQCCRCRQCGSVRTHVLRFLHFCSQAGWFCRHRSSVANSMTRVAPRSFVRSFVCVVLHILYWQVTVLFFQPFVALRCVVVVCGTAAEAFVCFISVFVLKCACVHATCRFVVRLVAGTCIACISNV